MNNNIKRAQALVNCFNKNNHNITYTCYVPSPTSVATITVGSTTTTAPGTNASVTNVGTKTNAILNFSIPRGDTGAAGTTTPAYANIYSTSQTVVNLTAATATTVTLATVGVSNNVNTATANKLTITNAGDYKIEYFLAGSPSVSGTLTLDVRKNGVTIDGSSVSASATANEAIPLQGTIISTLSANDILELDVASSVNANFTPSDGTNAYLIITKLN